MTTQPVPPERSLTAEDRERLEEIAACLEWLATNRPERRAAQATFLRRLASAPPEVSGEDDLQFRLDKAEAIAAECYRLTGSDPDGDSDHHLTQLAVQAVRELREENERVGEWKDRAIRAEAALEEAAAEFEHRAVLYTLSVPAKETAYRSAAQLLREKQAALKGGGADGE